MLATVTTRVVGRIIGGYLLFYADNNIQFSNTRQQYIIKNLSLPNGLSITDPLQNGTRASPLIAPH